MKPKKDMIIEFLSLKEFGQRAIREIKIALKTGVPNIQPKNVIQFDSVTSFRGFMTLQKIEILLMISNVKPKSIYELAKLLDRSLGAVQKDCDALARIRFIKLQKQKTGRGSITPKLAFDYDKIVVKLPKHPYELRFKAAA
ncbi:MAG: hypothetical protein V4654_14565 [Bdellovibrionota bacterium]